MRKLVVVGVLLLQQVWCELLGPLLTVRIECQCVCLLLLVSVSECEQCSSCVVCLSFLMWTKLRERCHPLWFDVGPQKCFSLSRHGFPVNLNREAHSCNLVATIQHNGCRTTFSLDRVLQRRCDICWLYWHHMWTWTTRRAVLLFVHALPIWISISFFTTRRRFISRCKFNKKKRSEKKIHTTKTRKRHRTNKHTKQQQQRTKKCWTLISSVRTRVATQSSSRSLNVVVSPMRPSLIKSSISIKNGDNVRFFLFFFGCLKKTNFYLFYLFHCFPRKMTHFFTPTFFFSNFFQQKKNSERKTRHFEQVLESSVHDCGQQD